MCINIHFSVYFVNHCKSKINDFFIDPVIFFPYPHRQENGGFVVGCVFGTFSRWAGHAVSKTTRSNNVARQGNKVETISFPVPSLLLIVARSVGAALSHATTQLQAASRRFTGWRVRPDALAAGATTPRWPNSGRHRPVAPPNTSEHATTPNDPTASVSSWQSHLLESLPCQACGRP
jgi:hypothetical protein